MPLSRCDDDGMEWKMSSTANFVWGLWMWMACAGLYVLLVPCACYVCVCADWLAGGRTKIAGVRAPRGALLFLWHLRYYHIVPMTSFSMQNSANNGRIETFQYALESSFNLEAISSWKFVYLTIPSQAMSVRVKL